MPNTGAVFVRLADFKTRAAKGLTTQGILEDLRKQMFAVGEAFALVIEPPTVPGIGTGGGLKGYVQDRAGRGLPAHEGSAWIGRFGGVNTGLPAGLHPVQHPHATDFC